jgi:hypothetical protein
LIILKGHRFHFVLPDVEEGFFYLDIMGAPPRVGAFAGAKLASHLMDTDWGPIPTVGLRDLVEIKKTQRLEDYPIIGRLAREWVKRAEGARTGEGYRWAVTNIFTLEELRIFFENHPAALKCLMEKDMAAFADFGRHVAETGEVPEAIECEVIALMQGRMNHLQAEDRRYWQPIIAQLKQFRGQGWLMPEGEMV